jgi:uncharacterized MnhB-related membrane protein
VIVVFDLLLMVAMLGLAGAAIFSRDLFRSVILFMVFGLLLALSWARLLAPDIAITEAALGAGLTGALLLNALRAFDVKAAVRKDEEPKS